MPHPRRPPEECRRIYDAVQRYGSQTAAARELGLPYGTLQHAYRDALNRDDWQLPEHRTGQQAVAPGAQNPAAGLPYERAWQTWREHIGATGDHYPGPCLREVGAERRKILLISDLHAPFHDQALVAEMLRRDGDADLAVVMGDLIDLYSISRFTKYEPVHIEDEFASATALLELLSSRIPRVLVIGGNHDARLERSLRSLSPELAQAVLLMTGGTLDPLEALCRHYPNVERVGQRTAEGQHVGWFSQLGDLVVAHAEAFSVVPGGTLRKVSNWFSMSERVLALQPWTVMAQAHTHQLSMFPSPIHPDRLLIEVGCLCKTPGYALQPRIGGVVQRRGYAVLDQYDGLTDVNSVRLVWLDHPSAQRAYDATATATASA